MSFLDLVAVSKHFGAVAAVDALSLSVAAGSRTAIVGASGSGKTTLLRLIAGFEAPDSGSIQLDGEILADAGHALPAYRRGIGIVAQDGALFPHLTIADNIGFGLDRSEPRRLERIADLIDMVGLDRSMLRRKPDQLSGGQQQRVALARALARKPRLMLLDEPFSALDTGLRVSTRKAVADLLSAAGVTTILVTHDQGEALSFADQVAVLRDGRLEQAGSPRDLYLRPKDRQVAELLGDAIILDADLIDGWANCALGCIPVDDRGRRGTAQIMLRPEQVFMTPAKSSDASDPDATHGEILDVDFGGGIVAVTVRLIDPAAGPDNRPGSGATLILRTSSIGLPERGAIVAISVRDAAHIFDATI
jgi:iron(III) transport system ATP-binding protein